MTKAELTTKICEMIEQAISEEDYSIVREAEKIATDNDIFMAFDDGRIEVEDSVFIFSKYIF